MKKVNECETALECKMGFSEQDIKLSFYLKVLKVKFSLF